MNSGPFCAANHDPITSNWGDCKKAAESLGYTGDMVAHINKNPSIRDPYSNKIYDISPPHGCYQSYIYDFERFHFNDSPEGDSEYFNGKVLCKRRYESKKIENVLL